MLKHHYRALKRHYRAPCGAIRLKKKNLHVLKRHYKALKRHYRVLKNCVELEF